MLPLADVLAWRSMAPWPDVNDVEQDLIITSAIFDIFEDDWLAERLAFRGGTALHRLYLDPPVRYSEDIDLVQRVPEPIGATLDRLRERLGWIGKSNTEVRQHPKIVFRFDAGSGATGLQPRKLKVEINTHEHFGAVTPVDYAVAHDVLTRGASVPSYSVDELLGTKVRALFQRRKGRDLFDLWWAAEHASVRPGDIVHHFERYMEAGGHAIPSRDAFDLNLAEKADAGVFDEVRPLLRAGVVYDPLISLAWFRESVLPLVG